MALTYRKPRWQNADNLGVWFPNATGTEVRGGHFKEAGENGVELWVTLSELPVESGDANGLLLADTLEIPAGAWVTRADVLVTTETTGAGLLNIGVVNATTMAIVDADGILAAFAGAGDGTDVGEFTTITKGSPATAGALMGTKLAQRSLLCGSYDTTAFTAGVIRLRVFYSMILDGYDA